jgi:recyclin-1
LLSEAQDLPNPLFLLTNAATFGQCSRLIDTVLAIEPRSSAVTHSSVSAVVFEMFEPHMASYLAQEGEWAREYLIGICTEWDTKIAAQNAARDGMDPTFLTAQNPQMVKRNVLAQFGKALLLPVTIVPKTVVFGVNALTAGGTMAFNAMSGGFIGAQSQKALATTPDSGTPGSRPERTRTTSTTSLPTSPPKSLASSSGTAPIDFSGFQMLLSIETAMQLVQADRDCLKRVQTFEGYSGSFTYSLWPSDRCHPR